MRTREQKDRYNETRRSNREEKVLANIAKNNLVGKVFGKLTVIEKIVYDNRRNYWLCLCECGIVKELLGYNLISGHSKSCGCLKFEPAIQNTIHGDAGSREYRSWSGMKGRCYNKKNEKYPDYGDRGIIVCQRWLNSYELFLEDMGRIPERGMQLDRINNDGNYEPSNCRWDTRLTQANNKRNNVFIEYNGERLTMSQWSRKLKINHKIFYYKKYQHLPKEQIVELFYKKVA